MDLWGYVPVISEVPSFGPLSSQPGAGQLEGKPLSHFTGTIRHKLKNTFESIFGKGVDRTTEARVAVLSRNGHS